MNKKVSIILIHYNQPDYVKTALDSIFEQTYKNIELIFADDCSNQIDVEDLKKYCKENNKNKIDIIWQINNENIGTVKNINKAVKKISGDYILIFAADDRLYDENVIEKFVKSFSTAADDIALIFGQCHMMDKELEKLNYKFIDTSRGFQFNLLSSFEQYKILCQECFVAMGACMFKSDVLKKIGLFDENYKYIEDWLFFIRLTNNGYKLMYNNIDALLHRDGGISHSNQVINQSESFLGYKKDLVFIFIDYVLPDFKKFCYKEKCNIYDLFIKFKNHYESDGFVVPKKYIFKLFLNNYRFFIHRKLSFINTYFRKSLSQLMKRIVYLANLFVFCIALNYFSDNIYNSYIRVLNTAILIFMVLFALKIAFNILIKILYKARIIKDR